MNIKPPSAHTDLAFVIQRQNRAGCPSADKVCQVFFTVIAIALALYQLK